MNESFSFVDTLSLIAKANLWEERDKAIKQKYDKLNNEVLPKVAHDKEAHIGCKDSQGFKHVCPSNGVVFADICATHQVA